MRKNILFLLSSVLIGCFNWGCSSCGTTENRMQNRYAAMATETLDSIYSHYGIPGQTLLRENYPADGAYAVTYLAQIPEETANSYSYLWPFSGTLSAVTTLYEATGDSAYISMLDTRVMPGLQQYLDSSRQPVAYASYVNSAPQSDRFYDDNIWLGIDFANLYLSTQRNDYLDIAKTIWKFVESGTDDVLGGGIYWCEQKRRSKNTCSNAPGSVFALKLYEATGDNVYLDKGMELYSWTKKNLQDSTDYLYYDNINPEGKIGKAKYAYNSGQMMQSAALLFKATSDSVYLEDATKIAENAFKYFFDGGDGADNLGTFPLFSKGNVWFTAVMMRGFDELHKLDRKSDYMDIFVRNLDYAWNHSRDAETGLFHQDWSGVEKDDKKWLLTQAAMVEMLGRASIYTANREL